VTDPRSLRLLAALPDPGPCTVRRAAFHAGLTGNMALRAAAQLVRAGLILATDDGRLTLSLTADALLELTDDGRRAKAEAERTG
jgi:DNA-binding IclR family transcriptional regulator